MAMKKAKKPMRGLDDFNRTMEGRDPKKRYPAYNVQPQKRKKAAASRQNSRNYNKNVAGTSKQKMGGRTRGR